MYMYTINLIECLTCNVVLQVLQCMLSFTLGNVNRFNLYFTSVGDQLSDHLPAGQTEECDAEDSPADQLQAGRGAVGRGDTSGGWPARSATL